MAAWEGPVAPPGYGGLQPGLGHVPAAWRPDLGTPISWLGAGVGANHCFYKLKWTMSSSQRDWVLTQSRWLLDILGSALKPFKIQRSGASRRISMACMPENRTHPFPGVRRDRVRTLSQGLARHRRTVYVALPL